VGKIIVANNLKHALN